MFAFWERLVTFIGLWIGFNVRPEHIPSKSIVSQDTKSWIGALRERWGVHGMSVVVVTSPEYKHGNGKWQKEILSFGTSDGKSCKITEETIWSSPTTSKFITGLALAHLIDSNVTLQNGERLQWETRLETIFPGWTDPPIVDMGAKVDPCDITLYDLGNSRGASHPRDAQFRFASMIVEMLSNRSFIEYANEFVMTPMQSTFRLSSTHDAREREQRVSGFVREGIDIQKCAKDLENGGSVSQASCMGEPRNIGWWPDNGAGTAADRREFFEDETPADVWYAGASGLTASSIDMSHLLRGVLDQSGPIPRLVKLDPLFEFLRFLPEDDSSGGGGFACEYQDRGDYSAIVHYGWMGGQTTMMFWNPEDGIGGIVAFNDEAYVTDVAYSVYHAVMLDLHGVSQRHDFGEGLQWDLKARMKRRPSAPVQPTPPSVDILGTYIYEGGLLKPKPVSDERSPEQDAMLRAIELQTEYHLNVNEPIYIAAMKGRAIPDRLIFTHWNANHWNWTAVNLYHRASDQAAAESQIVLAAEEETPIVVNILGTGGVEVLRQSLKFEDTWWGICGEKVVRSEFQPPGMKEGEYVIDIVRESFAARVDKEVWPEAADRLAEELA